MRNVAFISTLLVMQTLFSHVFGREYYRPKFRPNAARPSRPPTLRPTRSPTAKPISSPTRPRKPNKARPNREVVTPTSAPVASTSAPVASTSTPVTSTLAPVQPTPAPVQPTPAPVQPTLAPVQPTPAPVQPTPAPVQVTPTPKPVASAGSAIADQWLAAHNSRRTAFYAEHGLPPKDLKWSETIAASALNYSVSLLELSGCTIEHEYQGNQYGGENLAENWNTNSVSYTPEQVLQMWYDGEKNLAYGKNWHFSQVAWRGTSYVGCGTATKPYGKGTCYIHTCRYIAPGNCNIDETNLIASALEESSICDPFCPSEGCF